MAAPVIRFRVRPGLALVAACALFSACALPAGPDFVGTVTKVSTTETCFDIGDHISGSIWCVRGGELDALRGNAPEIVGQLAVGDCVLIHDGHPTFSLARRVRC